MSTTPARGSRTSFAYLPTGADGELPTTIGDSDFTELPRSGGNIDLSSQYFTSNNINSNRQKSAPTAGVKTVSGDIQADYGFGNFDYFFESLFRNSFASDSIKIGDEIKTFALQVSHLDTQDYFVHKGLRAASFSCEINTSGVVTSTFSLMGIETDTPAAALDDAPTPAPNSESFTHVSGTFKEGGVTSAVITGLNFTIDNNISNDWVLGSETPIISAADLSVSGSFDVFFTNLNLYQKFVDSTTTSIEATIKDPSGNAHTWKFAAVKLLGHNIPINDGKSITVSIPFEAFFSPSGGTTVELIRTAA